MYCFINLQSFTIVIRCRNFHNSSVAVILQKKKRTLSLHEMKIRVRNRPQQEVDFSHSRDRGEDGHLAVVDELTEGQGVNDVTTVEHAQEDGNRSFLDFKI